MRRSITLIAGLATLTVSAFAQPFYLRGGFDGWQANVLLNETFAGSNIFEGSATGLVPGTDFEFKAAQAGWDGPEAPVFGGNARSRVNQNGTLNVRFYNIDTPNDGWEPNTRRLGILNSNFEVSPGTWVPSPYILVGNLVNPNWSRPGVPTVIGGDGVRRASLQMVNNTEVEGKFAGGNVTANPNDIDWSYNVGELFACNTNNIKYTPSVAGLHTWELDLAGGRYRTVQAFSKTISGTLDLDGFTGDPSSRIFTVEVRHGGTNAVIETIRVKPDAGGGFTIGTVASVTAVNLHIKGNQWLSRNKLDVTANNGANTVGTITMINGDINDDNAIDFFDYLILSGAYETSAGESLYDANPYADLNGDGTIDFFDFLILNANYEKEPDL
ncbi:MAG: hypothetical protein JNM85_11060 [Chthonomonas sp.]|nr:hypothetical protein [Chthonomonas sp.]